MVNNPREDATISTSRQGSQQALRMRNRQTVLDALEQFGPLTQSGLTHQTNLSAGTISSLVKELVSDNVVTTQAVISHGRRATQVSLREDDRLVLAVDIGRAHLRIGIFNMATREIARENEVLQRGHRADETIYRARNILDKMLEQNDLSLHDLRVAIVGLPASIAPDGTVVQASVLPDWSDIDLHALCCDAFRVPVVLENDANLGAIAAAALPEYDVDNLIYIKLATGVGSGLILNRNLYKSTSGLVGEIGHLQIAEGGTICTCGNRGCLETVASVRRLVDDFNVIRSAGTQTLDDLISAALMDDPTVSRLLGDAGQALGKALATLGNLFAPDVVVIGGSLGPATHKVLAAARSSIEQRALPAVVSRTRFEVSRFGESTELIGAAVLGAKHVRLSGF